MTDAAGMARLFVEHVYRHRGPPTTIVSDRGPQFISDFWNEFCKTLGIQLKLSTAHHAQTDGQTEIVNQHIATRIRPFINHHQDNWSELLPMVDFAAAALPSETTLASPFLIDCGYEPRTSFDWHPIDNTLPRDRRVSQEDAQRMVKKMEDIWKTVQQNIEHSQEIQKNSADKHRREPDFQVGDHVWLSMKHYKSDRPSKKLDNQMIGPFRITEQVGHAYRLDLPPTMKIHNVFSPDKLRKAADDPLPGQVQEPPEPVEINDDEEWEVEQILDSRIHRRKLQYRVKWFGFDEDRAWYPASNFVGSPHRLRTFHVDYPERPGPPRRLEEWLRSWENGNDDVETHPDDEYAQD